MPRSEPDHSATCPIATGVDNALTFFNSVWSGGGLVAGSERPLALPRRSSLLISAGFELALDPAARRTILSRTVAPLSISFSFFFPSPQPSLFHHSPSLSRDFARLSSFLLLSLSFPPLLCIASGRPGKIHEEQLSTLTVPPRARARALSWCIFLCPPGAHTSAFRISKQRRRRRLPFSTCARIVVLLWDGRLPAVFSFFPVLLLNFFFNFIFSFGAAHPRNYENKSEENARGQDFALSPDGPPFSLRKLMKRGAVL